MSDRTRSFVWTFSPYGASEYQDRSPVPDEFARAPKSVFQVHLALGDIANDTHDNELWTTQRELARKTRLRRQTVGDALARLEADGFLKRLAGGKEAGAAIRYRFIERRHLPVVYGGSREGVRRDDTPVGGAATGVHAERSQNQTLEPEVDFIPSSQEPPDPQAVEKLRSLREAMSEGKRAS